MQDAPSLLIIADEDTVHGVERGYYPDMVQPVKNGNLMVLGYDEWSSKGQIQLKSKPLGNGKDVYIYNPYSGCYIQTSDSDLVIELCKAKCHAVKEAFVWMGAKHIKVRETILDKETEKTKADLKVSGKFASGDLNLNLNRITSLNFKILLESDDEDRKPKSSEDVRLFLQEHGLLGESDLVLLNERLKKEGKLSGKEKYTVTFLNEVDFVLTVFASFDYKVFNSSLDFSRENNHIHKIAVKIEIDF